MISSDETTLALRNAVAELEIRNRELGEENRILRNICIESGLMYEERLAANRHKRYFEQLCAAHPIEKTATASDVLEADPIVRGIAKCIESVYSTGLIARCFFAAFMKTTAQLQWRFGGRLSATFEGHEDWVFSKE